MEFARGSIGGESVTRVNAVPGLHAVFSAGIMTECVHSSDGIPMLIEPSRYVLRLANVDLVAGRSITCKDVYAGFSGPAPLVSDSRLD